ncbi:MAG: hypothetical protein GC154_15240 [bacterium]|nr:hypothetical protein [bacterium]
MKFVVCQKCMRVLVDGQWLNGTPPIGSVSYTTCPACGGGGKVEKNKGKGMIYPETQRKLNKKK